ncbi:MAG: molybdopterin-dependent oxidoreductase [Actinomycetes bacterium]
MTATADRRTIHGVCHHDCPDSCGWVVTVEGGVAVSLRGDPDHPYSRGELCPKVNRFLDRVHSPDRLLTPLRRTGPKGSGEFAPITWDDALDEIATNLRRVIDEHGPDAVVPFSGAGNQSLLAMLAPYRLWNALGVSQLQGALCGAVAGAGVEVTNGTKLALDPLELEHSRLVIIWGSNTRLTNRHLWPTIETARTQGARIIVIDPIRTTTAEAADEFVQPLPGTDVALMLAMMHVIIRDGLHDAEWVAAHTHGFDELRRHVDTATPAWAGAICGLEPTVIEDLAREYATTRPAAIRTLIGAEHHEHGGMFFRTLACLPALVGAWRERGGGFARSVGSWTGRVVDDDALTASHLRTRPGRVLDEVRLGTWLADPTLDPPIHALVVWNTNPMVSVPNVEGVRRGLARDDLFTVVHEQFLTDTARYADIVLPATTQIEQIDVNPPWGHLYLTWNEPAIAPVGGSVSDTELMRRLAAALGLDDPALRADDLTILRDALPTVDLDRLRTERVLRVPYPEDGRPFGDGTFPTATGRVEFVSSAAVALGQPALPTYLGDEEAREAGDRWSFRLLTPKHHTRFLNSSYSHLPNHGGREGGPFLECCATDAAALGVGEGATVRVRNDRGAVVLPVRISERLRPGVVAIPWGWWAEASGGTVVNVLTNSRLTDWGGGVAYSDTRVAVEPV